MSWKYKRQKSKKAKYKKGEIHKTKIKRLFLSKGGGIYELEEQTLGFRKIYDWLNKLKQTTAQTEEIHFLFGV